MACNPRILSFTLFIMFLWMKKETGLPLSKATRLFLAEILGFPSLLHSRFGFIMAYAKKL
jgi:hypothetical protein